MVHTIENPNKLLTQKNIKMAFERSYHKSISDILKEPVSRQEKLMKKNISKVLDLLYQKGQLNTSQLHNMGINWGSLSNVLDLLRKKKIILTRQFSDKKNNEKIYEVRKIRAIVYLDHIFNHDKILDSHNKLAAYWKSYNKILEKVPQDFLSWRIFAAPKVKKELGIERYGSLIGSLPAEKVVKILENYVDGDYCKNCQVEQKRKLLKQKRKFIVLTSMRLTENFGIQCEKCGAEQESIVHKYTN